VERIRNHFWNDGFPWVLFKVRLGVIYVLDLALHYKYHHSCDLVHLRLLHSGNPEISLIDGKARGSRQIPEMAPRYQRRL